MFIKKIKFFLIIFLMYQTPLSSKSTSFDTLNFNSVSKYFSGIIAYENKDNTSALEFFNSSKILLNSHEPYLKRYVNSFSFIRTNFYVFVFVNFKSINWFIIKNKIWLHYIY